jgi:hypothetical protein
MQIHSATIVFIALVLASDCYGQAGKVEIEVSEEKTGDPLTARIQVRNARGQPVKARGRRYMDGWNLLENSIVYAGRPGEYRFTVIRGPEFSKGRGGFTLDKNSSALDVVALPRHADLVKEGWYAGDLFVRSPAAKWAPWLAADGLNMAAGMGGDSTVAWTDGRWGEDFSYADDRAGSGLVLHHWHPPADVPRELPSTRLLVLAKTEAKEDTQAIVPDSAGQGGEPQRRVHAEIRRIWARDVPIWLASGRVDSIQVLSDQVSEDTEFGKGKFRPFYDPEPGRFRGALGPGKLSEYLYWQVLEAGFQLPPSAGSGFGASSNWLGGNRVYAQVAYPANGERLVEQWWQSLRSGSVFVTSGPLLRVTINGQLPGTVFPLSSDRPVELHIAAKLTVSEKVDYLDVIFNGRTLYQARLDEHARRGGQIPSLSIEESGWLVVRVITSNTDYYKIASTAPFYFEADGRRRISRKAVQHFSEWLDQAAKSFEQKGGPANDLAQPYLKAARAFWNERLEQATAE